MEDSEIIRLYCNRDEQAVEETEKKYGLYCFSIAKNILGNEEDARECLNDMLTQAWLSIPTQIPDNLKFWLGKVIRNISINLRKKQNRKKRYDGMDAILSELEECIPSGNTVESYLESEELNRILNMWIKTLSDKDQIIFVMRYWKGVSVKEIARHQGITAKKVSQRLYELRNKLREKLEMEDIYI